MSIKPYIVGIAGGSASGKSTLSDTLEKSLSDYKVKVFHMDYYFKPEDQRPYSKSPINGNMHVDNNHPLTMDLPRLAGDIKDEISKNDFDVIIVEGLLVLYDDAICSMLDLKLFVECRPDERIVRRLKRNMQWGESFDKVSGVYLDLVRFRHDEYVEPSKWRADLIINGSVSSDKALSIITQEIERSIKA